MCPCCAESLRACAGSRTFSATHHTTIVQALCVLLLCCCCAVAVQSAAVKKSHLALLELQVVAHEEVESQLSPLPFDQVDATWELLYARHARRVSMVFYVRLLVDDELEKESHMRVEALVIARVEGSRKQHHGRGTGVLLVQLRACLSFPFALTLQTEVRGA